MTVETIGPLRAQRVVVGGESAAKSTGKPPLTVVLMHGFGAPGDDLVGLAAGLDVPAGTRFVFPEAPLAMPAAYGNARAWWMIDMVALQRAMMRGEMRDLTHEVPVGMAERRAPSVGRTGSMVEVGVFSPS